MMLKKKKKKKIIVSNRLFDIIHSYSYSIHISMKTKHQILHTLECLLANH